jgi:hypothetical protein
MAIMGLLNDLDFEEREVNKEHLYKLREEYFLLTRKKPYM